MKGILIGSFLYLCAQSVAWFQTNGLLISDWMSKNVILTSIIMGPLVAFFFAHGTKFLYAETEQLWSARFLGFASGYIIFIPLTWYFFGETPFTLKNIVSFLLCVALISVQFIMK